MIASMTGFGRSEGEKNGVKIAVEIKSVNHRYLDLSIRMPKKFNAYEAELRKLFSGFMVRGKVDVSISLEDTSQASAGLIYNEKLAGEYNRYFKKMAKKFGLKNDMTVSSMAGLPEVFTMSENRGTDEKTAELLFAVAKEAVEAFRETRIREGEALKEDLCGKLEVMLANVDLVEERYPQIIEEYRQKLKAKLDEVKADTAIEESRLAAELVLYSDRLCTDEETVRLKNHIRSMEETLKKGGEAGRKLDFMAQEMNREANTILSKANDFRTSALGIALKTDIEKVREQIQNIE